MKRQTTAALLASLFALAACSGSEPAAEQPAKATQSAESQAPADAASAASAPTQASVANQASAQAAGGEAASEAQPLAGTEPAVAALSQEEQIKSGKAVYDGNCMACHGAEGKGVEGTFPPLEKSDYFAKDSTKLVHAVVKGVTGAIKVNGKDYNGVMPAVALSDQDVANVVTYVLNSFGNSGGQVTAAEVAEIKNK